MGEDIEKLIRIDKRTFYEVKEVIAWAKAHHFWAANIMSGVKLREQFPDCTRRCTGSKTKRRGDQRLEKKSMPRWWQDMEINNDYTTIHDYAE